MADDIKIVADFTDLQLMRRELVGVSKDAKASASIFEREYNKVERRLKQSAVASQRYYNSLLKVDRETKSAAQSASVFERELNKVEKATNRATAAQKTFENTSRKGMRRIEVISQQAGYQIGDLAIQLQGGTNAAVALGQQGSQLLGFFGPAGALAGAGLAITTAFVAPFIKAKEKAQDFYSLVEQKAVQLEMLRAGLEDKEALENNKEILRIRSRIARIQEGLERNRTAERERSAKITIAGLQEELSLAEEAATRYSDITTAIRVSEDLSQQLVSSAKARSAELEDQGSSEAKLNRGRWAAFQAQMAASKKLKDEADKIKATFEEQSRILGDQIALEAMRKQFGSDSFVIQRLQNDIALDNYEVELRRQGLNEKMIASLVEQKSVALSLKQEMIEMAALAQTTLNFAPTQELASRLRKYAGRGTVSDKDPVFGTGSREGKSIYDEPPKAPKAPKDALVSLMEDLELQRELLGVEQDRASVFQALGENRSKYTQDQIQQAVDATNAIRLQTEELEKQERVADTISQSFGDAFMSIVDGTMSAKDAFRSMAADIIRELYRILVVETMVQSIKRSIFPFADGGVIQGGKQVQAYANGGVVGGPTYFPMAGGKTGLMGEAGPEAIMPLKRGKGGKLGVEASGDTGAVNIVQNFSFAANGDESVKKIIAEAAPKIANMTQQQIMDARRRGGQMRSTFG